MENQRETDHERDYHFVRWIGMFSKDSIAIGLAAAGRAAPRFIGTAPPEPEVLCKALTRCTKRSNTLVVYEAARAGTAGRGI